MQAIFAILSYMDRAILMSVLRLFPSIEFVLQSLGGAKARSDRSLDIDLLPCLGVSTLSCASGSGFECSKPRENNLLSVHEILSNNAIVCNIVAKWNRNTTTQQSKNQ